MSALQAQTAEIQTAIGQQRDMVASAHARADDGQRAADSIAETLAQLMLQNICLMQRIAGPETVSSRRTLAFESVEGGTGSGVDEAAGRAHATAHQGRAPSPGAF